MKKEYCSCISNNNEEVVIEEYVCYCNHVTDVNIKDAIAKGCSTVQEVIKMTRAMKNSNCSVNNPKGTCCYSDIVYVFNKYNTKKI